MSMKKIQVSTATNSQLDWLVAKCEGIDPQFNRDSHGGIWYGWTVSYPKSFRHLPKFCTDPAQMWPIIEREKMGVWTSDGVNWHARDFVLMKTYNGATSLIAAARCFVVSKLGEEVEVPEELE